MDAVDVESFLCQWRGTWCASMKRVAVHGSQ